MNLLLTQRIIFIQRIGLDIDSYKFSFAHKHFVTNPVTSCILGRNHKCLEYVLVYTTFNRLINHKVSSCTYPYMSWLFGTKFVFLKQIFVTIFFNEP